MDPQNRIFHQFWSEEIWVLKLFQNLNNKPSPQYSSIFIKAKPVTVYFACTKKIN